MTKQARETLRRLSFVVPVIAAIFCFILDANTPNGLLDGFFYVSAVLLCQWVPNPKSPLYLAAGLTPAMWLGFALSETASPLWMAVTNRSIAIFAVWVAALVELELLDRRLHRLQHASWYALDLETEATMLRRSIRRTRDSVLTQSNRLRTPLNPS